MPASLPSTNKRRRSVTILIMENVYWFKELSRDSLAEAGGKAANLGEMVNAGFRVPPGFVVSAGAYYSFLDFADLRGKIRARLEDLDAEDNEALNEASDYVKSEILSAVMPGDVRADVVRAYNRLCGVSVMPSSGQEKLVAVRSSATAEDLPDASFAGQQETFLNVKGADKLVRAVQKCWASLFEARAIYYRASKGFDHLRVGIAVVVQEMVDSEKSGVMFTANPATNDRNQIVIEAGFGLGEAIVSGSITPDTYVVEAGSMEIVSRDVNKQERMVSREGWTEVPEEIQEQRKLSDKEIMGLAELGKRIQEHYGSPQDVEWAINGENTFIVQSRAITTLGKEGVVGDDEEEGAEEQKVEAVGDALLEGAGASPGIASGPVVTVKNAKDAYKVKKGDVLVARMTSPDFVPAMKRAAAIVTDEGGVTCHAAIVSRELGVPCVVGTGQATTLLEDGRIVTVDGSIGKVFEGEMHSSIGRKAEPASFGSGSGFVTGTRIYVNLAEPDLAAEVAQREVDGVGLMRAEFMIAALGEHPRKMIKEGREEEFVAALAKGLRKVCAAFNPRPVIYRANDFKTNEYRNLDGGEEFEPEEENPMIGFRGCFRYVKDPAIFKMELKAIERVRNKYGLRNLKLMIPFVRTVNDLRVCRKMVEEAGLFASRDFEFGMMCEVPSNVVLAKEFCEAGVSFMSIGSNDLTQLLLGVDRDSPLVAEDFDERDPAVLKSIRRVIDECHEHGVKVGICGQAPSNYPDFTEKLVEYGIDSISVNRDAIDCARCIVAAAEQRLILKNSH